MTTTRCPSYSELKEAWEALRPTVSNFERASGYYTHFPKTISFDEMREAARHGYVRVAAARQHADIKAGKLGGWRLHTAAEVKKYTGEEV